MLKKLLKYDFKAIFKFWWIGALTTFILSFVGAGCGSILETEKELPGAVTVFSAIGMVLVVLGIFAFIIFSELLIYVRYYKHLFTDEGYLTFTLPAKRHQILSSKLISGFTCSLLTGLIALTEASVIILTTFRKDIFVDDWYNKLLAEIIGIFEIGGTANVVISVIELLIIGLLIIALGLLFTYLCITIAGAISKKSKLGAAICIYYFASSAVSVFMYLFYFFGFGALSSWTDNLQDNDQNIIFIIILLILILFIAMLCILAYTLITWLIDRKLNLN